MIWFEEQVHPAVAQRLRVDRMILESRSGFQTIEIFETRCSDGSWRSMASFRRPSATSSCTTK